MSLKDLVAEENMLRLQRKQAADNATEEYLLLRLEAHKTGTQAPSVRVVAEAWGVSQQMIEHRLFRLRQQQREERFDLEDADDFQRFVVDVLTGAAQAMHDKKEDAARDSS